MKAKNKIKMAMPMLAAALLASCGKPNAKTEMDWLIEEVGDSYKYSLPPSCERIYGATFDQLQGKGASGYIDEWHFITALIHVAWEGEMRVCHITHLVCTYSHNADYSEGETVMRELAVK